MTPPDWPYSRNATRFVISFWGVCEKYITSDKLVNISMKPPGDESKAFNDSLRVQSEKEVDYESDTEPMGGERIQTQYYYVRWLISSCPNPFPDGGAADVQQSSRVTRDDTGPWLSQNPWMSIKTACRPIIPRAETETGHALTRWLVRPCVDWTQGCVLPTSRTRGVRKRSEVNRTS